MTYKEAKEQIDKHQKELDMYIMHDNPIHMVKGAYVAPYPTDNVIENIIYEECIVNHKDNADVLLEMNLFSNELTPVVVVLYNGNHLCFPLDYYINDFSLGNRKNVES